MAVQAGKAALAASIAWIAWAVAGLVSHGAWGVRRTLGGLDAGEDDDGSED
ncbi:hypothetical protein [Streptomyces cinerochromogenes]|uniref:hypothetical protein n=1 Tax=Streptomyces cinerochromogenes TaxID=66422 RepID=UPI0033A38078